MSRVRVAGEGDIDRILEIEAESISPPWTHGALLGEIYREDSFFAVAPCADSSNGAIEGFVILRLMADEGELLQIAVCTSSRRCGVAHALMGAALGFAHERALKSVHLEVRNSNEAAILLYKKHGFKPVRLRKDYYTTPTEDALVMRL